MKKLLLTILMVFLLAMPVFAQHNYRISDDEGDYVGVTDFGGLITATHKEEAIETGLAYSLHTYNLATMQTVCLKTPSTGTIHLTPSYFSENKANSALWEGVIWRTSTGTADTPRNRDRGTARTPTILEDSTGSFVAGKVVLDPTDVQTSIATRIWFGRTWSEFEGANEASSGEYILNTSTQYCVITISDVGEKGLLTEIHFHEE